MGLYRTALRPLLFQLDPERAHHLSMAALRALPRGVARRLAARRRAHPALHQRIWDLDFAHPLGLAAGLDKDAQAIDAFAALGFGHIEVGTLTARAQPGNPRPRLFRLRRDRAIINRMGFNNRGAADAARRLRRDYEQRGGSRRPAGVLGINIGKSKATPLEQALDDYRASLRELAPLADYLVVNVSSPNTPGLRDLQSEHSLFPLLEGLRAELDSRAATTPLLLKIAPDLHPAGIDAAVDAALGCGCQGLIASNTTIARDGLATPAERVAACGAGGLSGAPLRARSTAVLARAARRIDGRIPIVGVGGIDGPHAAWEKLCHGASLLQIYSALIYQGPTLIEQIKRGLIVRLRAAGLRHIGEAIGRDL